jgi:hypothetical protein
MHRARKSWIRFIVIAADQQRRHVNVRKFVQILHGFQIAVDDELAVRSPHFTIEVPGVCGIAGNWIVVGIRVMLIEIREVSIAPRQLGIFIGIAVLFPVFAFAKEAGFLKIVQLGQRISRHGILLFRQNFVHLAGRVERATQNQVCEVLLILESISLRQHAAIRVSEQVDLSQVQRLPNRFHVLNHVFNRVLAGVFKFF